MYNEYMEVMRLNYEALLKESDSLGLIVKEKSLKYNDGRIKGHKIAIRKDINTTVEKACVLSEELGHYYTSNGNILSQNITENRKQEYKARLVAYNKMIGLTGIIKAYMHGCHTQYEIADYLGVTEPFLQDALNTYKAKYGIFATVDNHVIIFEPTLAVLKLI